MSDARKVLVAFPEDANLVELPDAFPFEIWTDAAEWASTMALAVYYGDPPDDGSDPDPGWLRRTETVIAEAQRTLTGGAEQDKMLLFYAVDKTPVPVSLRYVEVGAPWDEAMPLLAGRYDTENVDAPAVEAFEMDDVEAAVRSIRRTVLDPADGSTLTRVVYVWRRDGMDYQVQAAFLDVSAVRDALPVLEAMVRGTETRIVG